jgi:protein involved in polysaccharide export with SLBB domain
MCEQRLTICDWNCVRRAGVLWAVIGLCWLCAGCNNKLLDPTQIGRFRPTPAVNVILNSLGVAEETPVAWENAEEPRSKDLVVLKRDYALRPGDLVQITIFELYQEGVPLVGQFLVSETGKISVPEVGVIQAAGLTETQLEEEIKKILSPDILKDPAVTVILLDSQQRTFSILGNGVPRSGRYLIPRYDFRLTDALATAGGPMQFNVSYIYVSRKEDTAAGSLDAGADRPTASELSLARPDSAARGTTERQADELKLMQPDRQGVGTPNPLLRKPSAQNGVSNGQRRAEIPEPNEPAERFELEREMLDLITPSARDGGVQGAKPAPTSEKEDEDVTAMVLPHGFRILVPPKSLQKAPAQGRDLVQTPTVMSDKPVIAAQASAGGTSAGQRVEWVFRDGKWVPIPVQSEATSSEAPPPSLSQPGAGGQGEWVLRNGQWVQVPKGQTSGPSPVAQDSGSRTLPLEDSGELPAELEWEQEGGTRLLRIPADKLLAGDSRYNVAIKPGDTVYVPVDIVGEFVIGGNVNRAGTIPLTGRPFTLKMAIAAAGGLGPLASPKNVEVIRRIGRDKEEIVMVDLDRIASGEQPDFFIKPYDLINVGTEPLARWRAVLRNAFRAAYGFGFVYDRNFADADYGKGFALPHWL